LVRRGDAQAEITGSKPVLDGVRVIEFGPFIALPLTGRILAALGATVIKVETNKLLDQLNYVPPWGNGMGQPEYQALKRRITLDVRSPEGAAVLERLIAVSDVFMTNFRRDALRRWGIDLDALRRRHRELIIVHQSGFGAGPYETYKLYGIMAQHICGVSMMSGTPGAPPCCLNSAYSDYHTPVLQALAVLGALDRRRRRGGGTLIEGSIFRSGVCTVATGLLECQISGRVPERRGNHDSVAVPHNVYPCSGPDEWCAVAVWDDVQWRALCQTLGRAEWAADARFASAGDRRAHEEQLDALLASVTRHWNKHELMEALEGAGVPAGIVAKGQDLATDPQLQSRDLYADTTYYVPDPRRPGIEWERGRDVLAARLPILFSETPCLTGPYRRIGEDNADVYRGLLGMSEEEMHGLTERGVLQ
jgi:benzylsuccinate CoA-transferase BbsF subunit